MIQTSPINTSQLKPGDERDVYFAWGEMLFGDDTIASNVFTVPAELTSISEEIILNPVILDGRTYPARTATRIRLGVATALSGDLVAFDNTITTSTGEILTSRHFVNVVRLYKGERSVA